jgi:hypothetical protein
MKRGTPSVLETNCASTSADSSAPATRRIIASVSRRLSRVRAHPEGLSGLRRDDMTRLLTRRLTSLVTIAVTPWHFDPKQVSRVDELGQDRHRIGSPGSFPRLHITDVAKRHLLNRTLHNLSPFGRNRALCTMHWFHRTSNSEQTVMGRDIVRFHRDSPMSTRSYQELRSLGRGARYFGSSTSPENFTFFPSSPFFF